MNKRQLKKAVSVVYNKIMPQIGPTGCGEIKFPSYLKFKPRDKRILIALFEAEKKLRKDCFRQACIETLGEDPEDWGLTMLEYEAKYNLESIQCGKVT